MQQTFYKDRLTNNFDLEVFTPNEADQEIIHQVIYQELCLGEINQDSRLQYLNIMQKLANNGAQGIILGCTEIGILVNKTHIDTLLFDTAFIHAQAAVTYALK